MSDPEPLFPDADHSFARIGELLGHGPPKPGRAPRPADEVWDALCAALRWSPEPGDQAAAKRVGRAVAALVAAGATPAQVRERASRYRQVMPNAMLTPEALVKHWSSLAVKTSSSSVARRAEPEPEGEPMPDLAAAAREAMLRMRGAMDVRSDAVGSS